MHSNIVSTTPKSNSLFQQTAIRLRDQFVGYVAIPNEDEFTTLCQQLFNEYNIEGVNLANLIHNSDLRNEQEVARFMGYFLQIYVSALNAILLGKVSDFNIRIECNVSSDSVFDHGPTIQMLRNPRPDARITINMGDKKLLLLIAEYKGTASPEEATMQLIKYVYWHWTEDFIMPFIPGFVSTNKEIIPLLLGPMDDMDYQYGINSNQATSPRTSSPLCAYRTLSGAIPINDLTGRYRFITFLVEAAKELSSILIQLHNNQVNHASQFTEMIHGSLSAKCNGQIIGQIIGELDQVPSSKTTDDSTADSKGDSTAEITIASMSCDKRTSVFESTDFDFLVKVTNMFTDFYGLVKLYRLLETNNVEHTLRLAGRPTLTEYLPEDERSRSNKIYRLTLLLIPKVITPIKYHELHFSDIVLLTNHILTALSGFHRIGYVHRDVRLDNIGYHPQTISYILLDYEFSQLIKENPEENKLEWEPDKYCWPQEANNAYYKSFDVYMLGSLLIDTLLLSCLTGDEMRKIRVFAEEIRRLPKDSTSPAEIALEIYKGMFDTPH